MIRSRMFPVVMALTAIIFLLPLFASAAGLPTIVPPNCSGADAATKCGICDLGLLFQNILNTMVFLAVFGAGLAFAYSGWIALTAGGSTAKYAKAKRIFGSVFIGILMVLGAWLIVDTLMTTLTGKKFGPWNKICQVLSAFEHHYA